MIIIPNATAYDNSPGYSASDYSTSIVGVIDTSIVGSTATYTYTAYDDAAGNPGPSITRTVTVEDYTPFDISSLTVRSDNSLDSYAKVGDEIRLGITTDDTIETVTGTILGDDDFEVTQRRSETVMRKIVTEHDINGNLTSTFSRQIPADMQLG